MSDHSNVVGLLNSLSREMKARGWLKESKGGIRSPEEALDIENRWLRRKVERLERAASSKSTEAKQ